MPSFNVDFNYSDHPKVLRLIGRLGNGADAIPVRLWNFCAKFFGNDGLIRGYSLEELEASLRWWGEAGKCIDALVALGFVEVVVEGIQVHDWSENQPHIKAYREKAKRMNEQRNAKTAHKAKKDNVVDYVVDYVEDKGSSLPSSPNTIQGITEQNKTKQAPEFDALKVSAFAEKLVERHCREISSNGSRQVGIKAIVDFFDRHPNRTFDDLTRAMEAYKAASVGTDRQFRIGPARFYADEWQTYIDGKPPPSYEETVEDRVRETKERLARKRGTPNESKPTPDATA